jgi:hypothetical protein
MAHPRKARLEPVPVNGQSPAVTGGCPSMFKITLLPTRAAFPSG